MPARKKDPSVRARQNKAATRATLTAPDDAEIPELPERPRNLDEIESEIVLDWHPQTLAWWADVWASPMAEQWDRSDVHNVVVVALLYDDIWRAGSAKARKDALAEYRLQRADLGLSPYARRRLEWTIETAEEAKDRGRQRRAKSQPASVPAPAPGADPRQLLRAVE